MDDKNEGNNRRYHQHEKCIYVNQLIDFYHIILQIPPSMGAVYLNDVEEGGETEFLHQSVRVKPKKGRIVIWPAAFPYVHRGNQPLSGEKYLLTSWINGILGED